MTDAAPNNQQPTKHSARRGGIVRVTDRRAPTQAQNLVARQLSLFAHRCFDYSDQVASGQIDFLDAVDVLQDAAVASGLADAVGMDVIQSVMGTAFANARRP